ncbi:MAG: hypothetical protein HN704_01055 [Bacteroidetes bacterium]|nr:hypothetical protein [Bacteroidota bacterium]MBT6685790.1 hypothetical protein [Bacteroidota bacterium]MBT7142360.1 hypothetical protein [Bacteroidota bacterium]MBT7490172.1 hypothetical protein [Bacteroidota bacterium]
MKLKNVLFLFAGFFGIVLLSGFGFLQEQQNIDGKNGIYEIVVRKVKTNNKKVYQKARNDYFKEIQNHDGFVKNKEFSAFYPTTEDEKSDVFVGITQWESLEQSGKSGESLMKTPVAENYFSSFRFTLYSQLSTIDNEEFDIEELSSDRVLEILVYKEKRGNENEIKSKFENYLSEISKQSGFIVNRNFNSSTDNLKAVFVLWESKNAFNESSKSTLAKNAKKTFHSSVEIKAYHATINRN